VVVLFEGRACPKRQAFIVGKTALKQLSKTYPTLRYYQASALTVQAVAHLSDSSSGAKTPLKETRC
jgi:hypothetical protein